MAWPTVFRKTAVTDPAAQFDRLMREHVPTLYRSAYRWTGAVDRAEDLVQELLVRLYPLLPELRELSSVRPWALRVMYRIFVDHLRRERHSPVQFGLQSEAGDDYDDAQLLDDAQAPDELTEQQLTQERIVIAWAQLGEEHRVVLSMHDIEGYTLAELSPLLDVPLGTLKSRLHRARARLRELLAMERFSIGERVTNNRSVTLTEDQDHP